MHSVYENHRTCRTFPMTSPKCLMRDFTNLNRIYKAPQTNVWWTMKVFRLHCIQYIDGLVQERRNSIAIAVELRLSCTNTSIFSICWVFCHVNNNLGQVKFNFEERSRICRDLLTLTKWDTQVFHTCWDLGQYHTCWCRGSLCCQIICRRDIDCIYSLTPGISLKP